jgi:small-conductance mechanosensitive channel
MTFRELWNFTLFTFQDDSVLTLGHVFSAVLLLLLGIVFSGWLARFMGRRLRRTALTKDTVSILQRVLFFFLVLVTVLMVLSLLNVPLGSFTFMSGAIAVAVGFGAQAIINNFISGWILMSERPVRIGDFIEMDDWRGVVERVGNRSTQIRRVDGVHIMVPNSLLLERTLVNWTLVDNNIRTDLSVGVAYGSPVREVERLIHQAVNEHPLILKDPAPVVVFNDFADSCLLFQALFWVEMGKGEKELRQTRSDIRFRIDELFRAADIVIAFPQRDVHFKVDQPIPVQVQERG